MASVLASFGHAATIKSYQKISALEGGFTEAGGVLELGDDFGESIANIGDLNGDGVIDLVVGALKDDDGGADRGAVYILFMNPNGTVKALQKISQTSGGFTATLNDGDGFGHGSTGLGDIDGDGVIDVAVGAPHDDEGAGDGNGAVYILFLNTDGTVKGHQKISELQGGLNADVADFGTDLAMLGDLDGDGVGDLWAAEAGGFRHLYLNADGTVKASRKFTPVGDYGTLIDDLDGDGVRDLVVGFASDNDGGTHRGAVWIIFLNADGTEKARTKISDLAGGFDGQLEDGDEFGQCVVAVGDRNHDGIPDIAVGAEHADAPHCTSGVDNQCEDQNTGELWILHLDRNGTVKSHELIRSESENFITIRKNANIGQAVTYLGDLDGDGTGDIATSADGDVDGNCGGKCVGIGAFYVLFLEPMPGGTPPPPEPPLELEELLHIIFMRNPGLTEDSDPR